MQSLTRALSGLMALTLLVACGGDTAAAQAPVKGAAQAPIKGAAPAPAKSAAPTKQAAPAVTKKPMGKTKMPAGDSKKPMGEMSGWKELDAFHQVLMGAWHPVATGDLAPARAKAGELLTAALAWRSSQGPAKCDNAAARGGMASFIGDARSYADAAKRNASDDAITVTLKRTHDAFETLAEPCMADMMKGMKMDMPRKP